MSLLDWSNLGATLLTFGCFSFAITSFGGKLGRLYGFENTSGYQYISHSPNSDELFEDIVKANENVEGTPSWAKDKEQLKKRCITYQKSLRYWNETSKYCLVKNTVRHQLIKDGFKLKEPNAEGCNNEILNNYSDGQDSLSYMVGKKKCVQISTQPETAPRPQTTTPPTTTPTPTTTETTTPTTSGTTEVAASGVSESGSTTSNSRSSGSSESTNGQSTSAVGDSSSGAGGNGGRSNGGGSAGPSGGTG